MSFPLIDTHQHLWDLARFRLPWLSGAPKLNRSFVMDDYFAATAGLNVVRTVYMEVDVEPSQQGVEADYVLALCARSDNPMAGAVISGRPAHAEFEPYIRRYAESPYIKGVRQVLHGGGTPAGYCLQPEFIAGIRLLGDLDLSFDLCMRPAELGDGLQLVDLCPETRFIIDHCGNAPVQTTDRSKWAADMAKLAARPNTVCKISGIVAGAPPDSWTPADLAPIIHHCLKEFGPDRVFFGGDWPVCTLAATFRQWVEALREIVRDLPADHQRQLFHDNAARFYRLSS